MATMTNEQIEQKKQQPNQLADEMTPNAPQPAEAGAIELSEDDLDQAAGGGGTTPSIGIDWLLKENGGPMFL
nr:hypothetical protein [Bacteroidaceae bacterium]